MLITSLQTMGKRCTRGGADWNAYKGERKGRGHMHRKASLCGGCRAGTSGGCGEHLYRVWPSMNEVSEFEQGEKVILSVGFLPQDGAQHGEEGGGLIWGIRV